MILNFLKRAISNYRVNDKVEKDFEVEVAEEAQSQEQTLLKENIYGNISLILTVK